MKTKVLTSEIIFHRELYCKINERGKLSSRKLSRYIIATIVSKNYKCYLGQCNAYPKNEVSQEAIIKILHKNLVQSVVHKHWVSKPRTILKTTNVTPLEFALNFCTSGRILLHHSFIVNEQASLYKL